MKRFVLILMTLIMVFSFTALMSVSAFAEEAPAAAEAEAAETAEEGSDNVILSAKAIASAIVVGLVGAAGAIAMGMTISKSAESMARQPEMAGKINSAMMLGLVFIETAIIYALVVAILVIFVL